MSFDYWLLVIGYCFLFFAVPLNLEGLGNASRLASTPKSPKGTFALFFSRNTFYLIYAKPYPGGVKWV
jgi:hypothetical protein